MREHVEGGEVLRDMTLVLQVALKTHLQEGGPSMADFKAGLLRDFCEGVVDLEEDAHPESFNWAKFGVMVQKLGCLSRFLGGVDTM